MTAGSALAGTEVFPAIQSAANVKITASQIKTFVGPISNSTSSDPAVGNDNTQGYSSGSRWFNTSTGHIWQCYSAGTGAARWFLQDYADHPDYIVNNWYVPSIGLTGTGIAVTINTARFIPFIPKSPITISSLGVRITTVGTTNFQLAIYASDPTTLKPTGTPLSTTSSAVNTSATTVTAALGANVSLDPGKLYWLGMNNGDSTATFVTYGAGSTIHSWLVGSSTAANIIVTSGNVPVNSWSTALTFGTWGDLTSATFTEGNDNKYALVIFKVVSEP